MPRYELPKVEGFTEEQVMETLRESGELEQYAVADEPADTNPSSPQETPPESEPAPVPPKEDVTDEEGGSSLPKTIPYERFSEAQRKAREREAALAAQLEEYRRRHEELLKAQQEFMRRQLEAQAPVREPEPVEEDPIETLIRSKVEERLRPIEMQLAAQRQAEQLQARIEQAEAEVKKAFADYDEVAGPVHARMAQAAMAAQNGDQNAARWLQGILMDENPPLKAYMIGRWEKARSQGLPPQQNTMAPNPASPQPPKPGAPAMPRGMSVSGGNTPDSNADARKVASMSLDEYRAWAEKNPAKARAYLRGEF